MSAPSECPECGVDITVMDAQGYADHMHDEHPDTWEVFRRVFASFGEQVSDTATGGDE